ncbi:hypothetical protein [Pantoea anthophila]|uniref:hypothetical protein n=1 Tax=Pantoea anthophila TaxID=470931 RepID=UPI00277D45A3|nr:hypothetical protein [Pantoea anthophila]MDQ1212433.1 hypothetical protein [Pantoea anthophila]
MITLDISTKNCPITREKAAFVAESLPSAVSGRPAAAPAFTGGMHGHISVLSQKAKPAKQKAKKEDGEFRSNPQQSDHVLTGC